jgi:hypothetical protein
LLFFTKKTARKTPFLLAKVDFLKLFPDLEKKLKLFLVKGLKKYRLSVIIISYCSCARSRALKGAVTAIHEEQK